MVPEYYDVPITCVVQSTEGVDHSSLYVRKFISSEILQPQILGDGGSETVYTELGHNLTLECKVFLGSNPDLVLYYWVYQNDTVIDCTDEIKTTCATYTKNENSPMFSISELHLININEHDMNNPYTCKMDNTYNNSSKDFILKLKEKKQDISQHAFNTSMATSITLTICFLILVFVGLFFRIDIVLLYRKLAGMDETIGDGKEYDAFLSFLNNSVTDSEEEHEFAFHILPTVMENHFGYKLCIRERDLLPGGAIVDDVHSFLEKSRRLIILLSKNYLSDKRMYELDTGLYKAMVERKIKVILVEYLPLCKMNIMPESLKLLKASKRVKWKGDQSRPLKSRFWKKIQYLMPVKPIIPCISHSKVDNSVL
ncbi:interleukin-18 receptor 1 [Bombina bombina]|uniref:interleukin-18 receptor 1 n=1 Tax=Bombina bombina TaxID=8345 RepID=UPI00235A872F|nr:interleukin-18 receptor 1 [Bombina bombina]